MTKTRNIKLLALLIAGLLCVFAGFLLLIPNINANAEETSAEVSEDVQLLTSAQAVSPVMNLTLNELYTPDNGETLHASLNLKVPRAYLDRLRNHCEGVRNEEDLWFGDVYLNHGYIIIMQGSSLDYTNALINVNDYINVQQAMNIYNRFPTNNSYNEYISINYVYELQEIYTQDNYNNGFTINVEIPSFPTDENFFAIYVDHYNYANWWGRVDEQSITGISNEININMDYLESVLKSEEYDLNTINQYSDLFKTIQKTIGLRPASENVSIELSYLTMTSYTQYEWEKVYFLADASFLQNERIIKHLAYQNLGIKDLSEFNAIYKDYSYLEDGQANLLSQRIVRKAESLSYRYLTNTGFLTVEYAPFAYSDFSIRIQNNDDSSNLIMDVYTTTIQSTDDKYILTFNYDEITQQLYNSCGWLFELTAENFDVTNNSNGAISVDIGENAVTVSFSKDDEAKLFDVGITATTIITEDVDYAMTYKYLKINDDLSISEVTSEPIIIKYSNLINFTNSNFYAEYGATIEDAISPAVLGDAEYLVYTGTQLQFNQQTASCVINVLYEYRTLLKITNNFGNTEYCNVNKNSLTFKASEFDFNVPAGSRIKDLSVSNPELVAIDFNDVRPSASTIYILTDIKCPEIIEIYAEITDFYPINVKYMTQYKNSPFLVKEEFTGEIKVSDYENVYELTSNQLLEIIGIETFNLLGLATVENIKVTRNGDAYVFDLQYTYASVKQIHNDGSVDEIKVYLTPYDAWLSMFGKDWSIMMLNYPNNKYFQFSNDVNPAELYGFFSVAVFEEQVKDLEKYFQNYSASGCKTVFQAQEVVGSDIYKFFAGLNFEIALEDDVAMWFCEILNDENKIYNSYFFFLDGTSDMNFIALNGADSYDDNSSASSNTAEDVGVAVGGFFVGAYNTVSNFFTNNPIGKVVGIILLVIAAALVIMLVVWIGVKLFKNKE